MRSLPAPCALPQAGLRRSVLSSPPSCLRPSPLNLLHRTTCRVQAASVQSASGNGASSGSTLLSWLQANGAAEQCVTLESRQLPGDSHSLDVVVAKTDLGQGQVVLSVPDSLLVTLDRVFESAFVAELLTTDKLSELAALTLFMMYEKKLGKQSFWQPYIQELDRQRARGPQAVESPLLWEESVLEELLQGSPVVPAVKMRLAGIRKEYEALDTMWFMAGSLFRRYPFDLPTETFSFDIFRQAFAAVQASTVHLQGVPIAKRFALVPLGPPLLSYSSTSKALLKYNLATGCVELTADKAYRAGEAVHAWCGPQPNSRLLVNYGIVDESNPYDKLQVTATLPTSDPLFQLKRLVLNDHGLSTQQTFDLQAGKPLPTPLLPYLRVAFATEEGHLEQVEFQEGATGVCPVLEATVVFRLLACLQSRLDSYRHPLSRDIEIVASPTSTPRERIAARLTKIEKGILISAQERLRTTAGLQEGQAPPAPAPGHANVQLS